MKLLSPLPRPRAAGFTLIELLTVISIIAILAAASIGGYSRIVEGVRKKEASIMAMAVSNAVEQFYADYNRLPKSVSAADGTDSETTTEAGEGIVKVLKGMEGEAEALQNTRNTDYVEGIKPAKAAPKGKVAAAGGSDKWVNGIVSQDDTWEIVDPWGNYYKMKLDSDYSKDLENPNIDQIAEGRPKIIKRVIVWSPGKDGKEETWEDNPMSWE
ncbi:MAG: xcpT 2 [Verrucomicrobiales bacterium]|nr:xcpT 2 [Verrucomicrobiales bacterium]